MKLRRSYKKLKVVAVSGGFDPLNGLGHITHIQEARKLGDCLVVILSRDDQLVSKKGRAFYPSYADREAILKELKSVDKIIMNIDKDETCTETLRLVKPNIFAKGGDRAPDNMPKSELNVCKEIECEIVYGVGEAKRTSSSQLADNWLRHGRNDSASNI